MKIKDQLCKLLDVKSLWSLSIVNVICFAMVWAVVTGGIANVPQWLQVLFTAIASSVTTYYFTKEKNEQAAANLAATRADEKETGGK